MYAKLTAPSRNCSSLQKAAQSKKSFGRRRDAAGFFPSSLEFISFRASKVRFFSCQNRRRIFSGRGSNNVIFFLPRPFFRTFGAFIYYHGCKRTGPAVVGHSMHLSYFLFTSQRTSSWPLHWPLCHYIKA